MTSDYLGRPLYQHQQNISNVEEDIFEFLSDKDIQIINEIEVSLNIKNSLNNLKLKKTFTFNKVCEYLVEYKFLTEKRKISNTAVLKARNIFDESENSVEKIKFDIKRRQIYDKLKLELKRKTKNEINFILKKHNLSLL